MTRALYITPAMRGSAALRNAGGGRLIGCRSHKGRLGAVLAIGMANLILVTSATAQQIPIIQSGADGRYERQIDPKTAIPGYDGSTSRTFRGAIDELVGQLAAMPSVNSPPAPVCHRLMTYIEITPPHGVPAASVSVRPGRECCRKDPAALRREPRGPNRRALRARPAAIMQAPRRYKLQRQ